MNALRVMRATLPTHPQGPNKLLPMLLLLLNGRETPSDLEKLQVLLVAMRRQSVASGNKESNSIGFIGELERELYYFSIPYLLPV